MICWKLAIFLSFDIYRELVVAVHPLFFDNYKIDSPSISSFETASVQICIHKCGFHDQCNVVNVMQTANSMIQCVFARIGCSEDLEGKLRRSNGWQLYVIRQSACVAEMAVSQQAERDSSLSSDCQGQFKIKHTASGMYLHYKKHNPYIAHVELKEELKDEFCINRKGYLKRKEEGFCLKKMAEALVMFDLECNAEGANFYWEGGRIYYQNKDHVLVPSSRLEVADGTLISIFSPTVCSGEICEFEKETV